MSKNKVISLVLLIAGIGLVIWGYQISESVGSQLSKAFTGAHTDNVMVLYISGAVCIVVGLFMSFKRR